MTEKVINTTNIVMLADILLALLLAIVFCIVIAIAIQTINYINELLSEI